MNDRNHLKYSKRLSSKAQAIVEFAIALPVLLALIVGILEVGRLLFIYSAVTNASRNASRYASAVGLNDSSNTKFNDCASIENLVSLSAYLVSDSDLTTNISYDHGPGTGAFDTCDGNIDTGVVVVTGDRVTVQVTAEYRPMVNLVPIGTQTIIASSSRTILGIIQLD